MTTAASRRSRPLRSGVAGLAVAALALSACTDSSASDAPPSADGGDGGGGTTSGDTSGADAPVLTSNVKQREVTVDTEVSVTVADGTLERVRLTYGRGQGSQSVPGDLDADGTTWTAGDLLEPGQRYQLVMAATGADGERSTQRQRFRSEPLTLAEQTYPSVSPLEDTTVGVGMPVVVSFDVPVTDRVAAEQRLTVTSTPQVQGSWHWLDDTEVHFRPREYWPAGTQVHLDADLNGVDVGGGIYGQTSRSIDFTVGDSVVSQVDVGAHTMDVFVNGELARTMSITGGKPGYETRDGVKVVMEKYETKVMDASTTGVSPGDPEYYNLEVEHAMRVTTSGEFVHAAPWSTGSQGSDNVSHGCIGLSPDDAAWLYDVSQVGDVIEVSGSGRTLETGNGWTDWNESYRDYRRGSAL